ncbi:MAG: C25 family peptidase propeptide domain-containing protein [Ignavibacteriaceae bacterium]|nr:C25 family peptidase propeptide domain-containing protein [Ignavibacteriaceae bacterium]
MKFQFSVLLLFPIILSSLRAQTIKILESKSDHISIELSFSDYYPISEKIYQGKKFTYIEKNGICFRKPGEPWVPTEYYYFGIPFNKIATCKILNITQEKIANILIMPYPDSANQPIGQLKYDPIIYIHDQVFPSSLVKVTRPFIMRYVKGASIEVSPYQYNPITRELIFNKKIVLQISFDSDTRNKELNIMNIKDKLTEDFVASIFINPSEAKGFIGKQVTLKNSNSYPSDTVRYHQPITHSNY